MGFLAAVPAIASVVGGLFGKKKKGGDTQPAQVNLPEFQTQSGQQLANYIKQYLSQYQPGKEFGGDFVAPTSEAENTGLARLNQFLAAPELGELFEGTKQNVLDTVGGKFVNPAESPFIQSMINLSKMNLQDAIDASRASAGSRGTYFTKSAMEGENRLRERTQNFLDTQIGSFINQERDRQLKASPLALALEQYSKMDVPLRKIGASQTYGSLPRLIEQAGLESEYQDFLRTQTELAGVPGAAQSLFGTQTPNIPSYTTPVVQSNNTLGNIIEMISKLNLSNLGGTGSIWDKIGSIFK